MAANPTTQGAPLKLQKKQVWTLSGAHLFNDLMTTGIVPALLPLYKEEFHLSYIGVGFIVLASYLTSSVMQPLFGLYTDRHPKAFFLPLGVTLSGVGLSLTGFAPSLPWLLIAIAFSGLGSGAFHPEASRGAHLASGPVKGMAQAIFQVGGNMGQALGPLMIPLFLFATGVQGLRYFIIPSALIGWMTFRILPWYRRRIAEERSKAREITGKNQPLGLTLLVIVVILRSFAQISLSGFLPFYYLNHHLSLNVAELFTFLFLAAGALATYVGGTLSDRFSKKQLVLASVALAIPFAWLLPHLSGWMAAIDLFLLGFTILSSFAVTVVYGQMLLPRNIGMASGLIIGFGVGAGGIGATLLGVVADRYGIPFIFDLIVWLPVTATLISIFLPSDAKKATPVA